MLMDVRGKKKFDESKHDLGMTPRENGLSDHLSETQQMNAKMKDRTSDQNGALESQQANEQCAQESEPAGKTDWLGLTSVEGNRQVEGLGVLDNGTGEAFGDD